MVTWLARYASKPPVAQSLPRTKFLAEDSSKSDGEVIHQ